MLVPRKMVVVVVVADSVPFSHLLSRSRGGERLSPTRVETVAPGVSGFFTFLAFFPSLRILSLLLECVFSGFLFPSSLPRPAASGQRGTHLACVVGKGFAMFGFHVCYATLLRVSPPPSRHFLFM